jgi:tRNA1(Val) A37 N6-methylase TrmN6
MDEPSEVTEDALLGGRVPLLQPARGHRAGTDAVLLAAAVDVPPDGTIADLGAGTGAVGLMVAQRARTARFLFVERDPWLARLCADNIRLNGLEERAEVIEADLLAPARERRARGLLPASVDVLATNPPFLEEGRSRTSPDPRRSAAHTLAEGGLERWIRACADLLKPKGQLALIHRADRLADCLRHLERAFGAIRVRPVHHTRTEAAVRVVITAVKGSRAPLLIAPPLVLHRADGRFTPEAEAMHRGERSAG